MKRDALLFLGVFVAAFALLGAVLFHNRSGNQLTQQAPTLPPAPLQQNVQRGATMDRLLEAPTLPPAPLQQTVTPVETVNTTRPKPEADRGRSPYRVVSGRADNRLVPDLRGLNVAVFADSISCEQLSRSVLRLNGVIESSLKSADVVLVVVRSSLSYPLDYSHDSLSALKRDSDMQLNISGPNAHIYVFSIDDNLRTTELFHTKFKWDDSQFVR